DKAPEHDPFLDQFDHVIKLPNVGRCQHCFIYHIVEHYDNLHDTLVFSANYPLDQLQFSELIDLEWDIPTEGTFWAKNPPGNYKTHDIPYWHYIQIPDVYVTYGAAKSGGPDYCRAHNIQQFREMYFEIFGVKMPEYFDDYPAGGAFRVRGSHLRIRSLDFWNKCLHLAEKYSDSPWAFERFWHRILNPEFKVTC